MAKTAIIPIDGFLRKPVGNQLSDSAWHLYRALSGVYGVVLYTNDVNREHTLNWLTQEGIFRYDNIIYGDFQQNETDSLGVNISRYMRMVGYRDTLWVTVDPCMALDLISQGQSVLQYVDPVYALPEWLPGNSPGGEAWESMAAKVQKDRAAKMLDDRLRNPVD